MMKYPYSTAPDSPSTLQNEFLLTPKLGWSKRQLFIAWAPFQRRAVTMQSAFGYELHHLGISFTWRALRGFEYVIKALQTLYFLLSRRPQVLWLQMPPAPLLYLAFLYRCLLQPQLTIIADCHNATFRKPWIQFPGVIALLNHCEQIIVHNPWVEQQALSFGIRAERLIVLRDRPLSNPAVEANLVYNQHNLSTEIPLISHPWLLVPCSFNDDEPIAELLAAATLAPDLTFVVTGNPARAKGRHHWDTLPPNVVFTGFVSEAIFNHLLAEADAVVCLTKLEGIQLSAANEAMSYGKAMVLAHTQLLRTFFDRGAIYVDPHDPQQIAVGCCRALEELENLRQDVQLLKVTVDQQWLEQSLSLQILLRS